MLEPRSSQSLDKIGELDAHGYSHNALFCLMLIAVNNPITLRCNLRIGFKMQPPPVQRQGLCKSYDLSLACKSVDSASLNRGVIGDPGLRHSHGMDARCFNIRPVGPAGGVVRERDGRGLGICRQIACN